MMDTDPPMPLDALAEDELTTLFLQGMIDGGATYREMYRAILDMVRRHRGEGMADPEIAEHVGGLVADVIGQGRDAATARGICGTLTRLALLERRR